LDKEIEEQSPPDQASLQPVKKAVFACFTCYLTLCRECALKYHRNGTAIGNNGCGYGGYYEANNNMRRPNTASNVMN